MQPGKLSHGTSGEKSNRMNKGDSMKNQTRFIALKIFALIAFLSAGAFAQALRDDISTVRWRPVAINNRAINAPDAFFEITNNRNRFTANVGCNEIGGAVRITGQAVRFTNVRSTRKFCNDRGVMTNENNFIRALERATRYTQTGNVLRFFARNTEVVRFRPAADNVPDQPLPGSSRLDDRKWILEEIRGRRIGKIETEPFLVFEDAKFSAGGNTGCNVFGGSYIDKRDRVKIFDIVSTMRACVEDNRMQIERQYLEGLREADRFQIRGGRLFLYNDNTLLLTFRGVRKDS